MRLNDIILWVVIGNLLLLDIFFIYTLVQQNSYNNKTLKTFKGLVDWIKDIEKYAKQKIQ